jgi:hypothetical protein
MQQSGALLPLGERRSRHHSAVLLRAGHTKGESNDTGFFCYSSKVDFTEWTTVFGTVTAAWGTIVAWGYQSGSKRLATVDLFASEISAICRVCRADRYCATRVPGKRPLLVHGYFAALTVIVQQNREFADRYMRQRCRDAFSKA